MAIITKPNDILWNGLLYEENWTAYYKMIHCPNEDLKAYFYPDKHILKVWIKEHELKTLPLLSRWNIDETVELTCSTREEGEYYIMWVYNTINYIKQYV